MLRELVNNLLEVIAPSLVLLILLLLRKHWKGIRFMRTLFLYYLCSSFNLAVATYLAYINSRNLFWYNLNGLMSALTLSAFYYQILQLRFNKLLVILSSFAGLTGYGIILLFFDDRISFNSAGYSIISFMVILYSLLFLREMFSFANNDPIHISLTIWIVSALLTYFLSSFLIQVSYKNVTHFLTNALNQKVKDSWVWGMHNVLYFLANLIVAVTLFRFFTLTRSDENISDRN